MLKYTTDRFSRLLQHPARKWSGSILTTPEPTRGSWITGMACNWSLQCL